MSDENTNVPNKGPIVNRPYRNSNYENDSDGTDATQDQTPDATQTNPSATPSPGPDLNPEDRTYKTRYDSLKAHYDRMINESRAKEAELKSQLIATTSANRAMPKTPEELAQWRATYPDLHAILITAVRQELKGQEDALNVRVSQVEELATRTNRERAENVLSRLHPDFPELRASDDFHEWAKEQPKIIQDWLYDNKDDPLLAARAIDLYKGDRGLKKSAPTKPAVVKPNLRQAASAVSVGNRSVADVDASQGKQWKTSEIGRLSRKDFEKFEAEIEKARDEGRLIFDSK